MTGFRRLFTPLRIGTFTVANRIVNPTHSLRLPEARELRYLAARAAGGCGLIGVNAAVGVMNYTVGPVPHRDAPDWDEAAPPPATDAGIAFYDDVVTPKLRARAEVVHAGGAKCFGQVFHYGAAPHEHRVHPPVAPSAVADPYDALSPHPLTAREIEELVVAFAHGIRRVRDAGFDAAELHAAHGYLVHQFLSPYFNRRTDRWGGSRDNRLRFVRAVLARARELVGEFPVGLRIGVDGGGAHRGITVAELAALCRDIGPEVAYLSVSGGNFSGFGDGPELAYVSPWYREPGFNVAAAAAVKAVTDVPVLVTGRIADAAVAEGILADGAADLVGMVRALIADPDLPVKTRTGRSGDVRMCLGMSECHHIGPFRTPVTCAVNAAAGREDELDPVPATHPKTVVVVGAGPAGLEAARVARLRGHTVYLCDAEREIGGTPRLLGRDPNRRNLRDHAVFYRSELRRLGVELMLGQTAGAEDLVGFGPDAVVVATGGRPLVPDLPGVPGPGVATALDILTGRADVAPRTVVFGGLDRHLAAGTVAEYLADRGSAVELVSEQVDFATGAEDGTRLALLHRLLAKSVVVTRHHRLVALCGTDVEVEDTFTRARRIVPDAGVVLACGLVPDDALARALDGRVAEVHTVGDALAPRRLAHATLDGARVGRLL